VLEAQITIRTVLVIAGLYGALSFALVDRRLTRANERAAREELTAYVAGYRLGMRQLTPH